MCGACLADPVESELSLAAFVDDVFLGFGSLLQRVVGRAPRQLVMSFLLALDGEVLHRQRLYHYLAALALGHEAGYGLVDGAPHEKFERGIESVTHVAEVLMAHQLDKGSGHFRHTGLDIRLVPHRAACPVGLIGLADVGGDLAHQHVGEHSRVDARGAVYIGVAPIGVIDAECAHYGVVDFLSGIGMKGHGDIYRYLEAVSAGKHS